MKRRVVITACSAITPIGHGKDEIIRHLAEGVSGVKKIKTDDLLSKHIDSGVFGTVDYTIDYDFKRRYRKTMGPVSYYACQVAKEVLENSGLDNEFITSGKLGVAFGSTHGSPTVQREIYKSFFSESPSGFSSIGASTWAPRPWKRGCRSALHRGTEWPPIPCRSWPKRGATTSTASWCAWRPMPTDTTKASCSASMAW